MPTKTAPDYSKFTALVGKKFTPKNERGLNHGAEYEIVQFIKSVNFGARGQQPAFKLHRTAPSSGVHTEPCEAFLANHELIEEPAAAAQE